MNNNDDEGVFFFLLMVMIVYDAEGEAAHDPSLTSSLRDLMGLLAPGLDDDLGGATDKHKSTDEEEDDNDGVFWDRRGIFTWSFLFENMYI